MQRDFELVGMSSRYSDFLPFYFQFGAIFKKVEIAIHSGDSLAARPDLAKQLYEDIGKKQLVAFF